MDTFKMFSATSYLIMKQNGEAKRTFPLTFYITKHIAEKRSVVNISLYFTNADSHSGLIRGKNKGRSLWILMVVFSCS